MVIPFKIEKLSRSICWIHILHEFQIQNVGMKTAKHRKLPQTTANLVQPYLTCLPQTTANYQKLPQT